MVRFVAALAVLLAACSCSNTPVPVTRSAGFHQCLDGRWCGEFEACRYRACVFVGDPNGPGPGDTGQESGYQSTPWR